MLPLIDSHCHLDFAVFDNDREEVIHKANQAGVHKIVIPGVRSTSWSSLIQYCKRFSCLHFALGLHPYFIDDHQLTDIDRLKQLLVESDAVAVGETGLDFFDKRLDRQKQIALFAQHIELANECRLPLIIHARKAHNEILSLIRTHKYGGIVHAFNSSIDIAKRYLDLGFKLGFGGMATFPHSVKLHELLRTLPLTGIVLETDAPDMSGYGYRGERNSPVFLPVYFETIAKLRRESRQIISQQTTHNTLQVLNL